LAKEKSQALAKETAKDISNGTHADVAQKIADFKAKGGNIEDLRAELRANPVNSDPTYNGTAGKASVNEALRQLTPEQSPLFVNPEKSVFGDQSNLSPISKPYGSALTDQYSKDLLGSSLSPDKTYQPFSSTLSPNSPSNPNSNNFGQGGQSILGGAVQPLAFKPYFTPQSVTNLDPYSPVPVAGTNYYGPPASVAPGDISRGPTYTPQNAPAGYPTTFTPSPTVGPDTSRFQPYTANTPVQVSPVVALYNNAGYLANQAKQTLESIPQAVTEYFSPTPQPVATDLSASPSASSNGLPADTFNGSKIFIRDDQVVNKALSGDQTGWGTLYEIQQQSVANVTGPSADTQSAHDFVTQQLADGAPAQSQPSLWEQGLTTAKSSLEGVQNNLVAARDYLFGGSEQIATNAPLSPLVEQYGLKTSPTGVAAQVGVGTIPGGGHGNPFLDPQGSGSYSDFSWRPKESGYAFQVGASTPESESPVFANKGTSPFEYNPESPIVKQGADLSGIYQPGQGTPSWDQRSMLDSTSLAEQRFPLSPVPTGDKLSSGFLTPERIGEVPIGLTPATLPAGSNPVAVKTTFESAKTPLYNSSTFAPIKEPGWGDVYLAKTGQKEISSGLYDSSKFVSAEQQGNETPSSNDGDITPYEARDFWEGAREEARRQLAQQMIQDPSNIQKSLQLRQDIQNASAQYDKALAEIGAQGLKPGAPAAAEALKYVREDVNPAVEGAEQMVTDAKAKYDEERQKLSNLIANCLECRITVTTDPTTGKQVSRVVNFDPVGQQKYDQALEKYNKSQTALDGVIKQYDLKNTGKGYDISRVPASDAARVKAIFDTAKTDAGALNEAAATAKNNPLSVEGARLLKSTNDAGQTLNSALEDYKDARTFADAVPGQTKYLAGLGAQNEEAFAKLNAGGISPFEREELYTSINNNNAKATAIVNNPTFADAAGKFESLDPVAQGAVSTAMVKWSAAMGGPNPAEGGSGSAGLPPPFNIFDTQHYLVPADPLGEATRAESWAKAAMGQPTDYQTTQDYKTYVDSSLGNTNLFNKGAWAVYDGAQKAASYGNFLYKNAGDPVVAAIGVGIQGVFGTAASIEGAALHVLEAQTDGWIKSPPELQQQYALQTPWQQAVQLGTDYAVTAPFVKGGLDYLTPKVDIGLGGGSSGGGGRIAAAPAELDAAITGLRVSDASPLRSLDRIAVSDLTPGARVALEAEVPSPGYAYRYAVEPAGSKAIPTTYSRFLSDAVDAPGTFGGTLYRAEVPANGYATIQTPQGTFSGAVNPYMAAESIAGKRITTAYDYPAEWFPAKTSPIVDITSTAGSARPFVPEGVASDIAGGRSAAADGGVAAKYPTPEQLFKYESREPSVSIYAKQCEACVLGGEHTGIVVDPGVKPGGGPAIELPKIAGVDTTKPFTLAADATFTPSPLRLLSSETNYLQKAANLSGDIKSIQSGRATLAEVRPPSGVTSGQFAQDVVRAYNDLPDNVAPYRMLGSKSGIECAGNCNNFTTQVLSDAGLPLAEVSQYRPRIDALGFGKPVFDRSLTSAARPDFTSTAGAPTELAGTARYNIFDNPLNRETGVSRGPALEIPDRPAAASGGADLLASRIATPNALRPYIGMEKQPILEYRVPATGEMRTVPKGLEAPAQVTRGLSLMEEYLQRPIVKDSFKTDAAREAFRTRIENEAPATFAMYENNKLRINTITSAFNGAEDVLVARARAGENVDALFAQHETLLQRTRETWKNTQPDTAQKIQFVQGELDPFLRDVFDSTVAKYQPLAAGKPFVPEGAVLELEGRSAAADGGVAAKAPAKTPTVEAAKPYGEDANMAWELVRKDKVQYPGDLAKDSSSLRSMADAFKKIEAEGGASGKPFTPPGATLEMEGRSAAADGGVVATRAPISAAERGAIERVNKLTESYFDKGLFRSDVPIRDIEAYSAKVWDADQQLKAAGLDRVRPFDSNSNVIIRSSDGTIVSKPSINRAGYFEVPSSDVSLAKIDSTYTSSIALERPTVRPGVLSSELRPVTMAIARSELESMLPGKLNLDRQGLTQAGGALLQLFQGPAAAAEVPKLPTPFVSETVGRTAGEAFRSPTALLRMAEKGGLNPDFRVSVSNSTLTPGGLINSERISVSSPFSARTSIIPLPPPRPANLATVPTVAPTTGTTKDAIKDAFVNPVPKSAPTTGATTDAIKDAFKHPVPKSIPTPQAAPVIDAAAVRNSAPVVQKNAADLLQNAQAAAKQGDVKGALDSVDKAFGQMQTLGKYAYDTGLSRGDSQLQGDGVDLEVAAHTAQTDLANDRKQFNIQNAQPYIDRANAAFSNAGDLAETIRLELAPTRGIPEGAVIENEPTPATFAPGTVSADPINSALLKVGSVLENIFGLPTAANYSRGSLSPEQYQQIGQEVFIRSGLSDISDPLRNASERARYIKAAYDVLKEKGLINTSVFRDAADLEAFIIAKTVFENHGVNSGPYLPVVKGRVNSFSYGQLQIKPETASDLGAPKANSNPIQHLQAGAFGAVENVNIASRSLGSSPATTRLDILKLAASLYNVGQNSGITEPTDYGTKVGVIAESFSNVIREPAYVPDANWIKSHSDRIGDKGAQDILDMIKAGQEAQGTSISHLGDAIGSSIRGVVNAVVKPIQTLTSMLPNLNPVTPPSTPAPIAKQTLPGSLAAYGLQTPSVVRANTSAVPGPRDWNPLQDISIAMKAAQDAQAYAQTPEGQAQNIIKSVRSGGGDVPRVYLAALLQMAGLEGTSAYGDMRSNAARELTGRQDSQGVVTSNQLRVADAAIEHQIQELRGEVQSAKTIAEVASQSGRPQIPGLEGKVVYFVPLGDPANANKKTYIIEHNTVSRPGTAGSLAYGQSKSPSKVGAQIYIETDGTVYFAVPENIDPGHVRGNRNDNRFLDNNTTWHIVKNTNSIGIEFSGNFPNYAQPLTPEQIKSGLAVTIFLQQRYGITPDHIYAHDWVDYKSALYEEGAQMANAVRSLDFRPGSYKDTTFIDAMNKMIDQGNLYAQYPAARFIDRLAQLAKIPVDTIRGVLGVAPQTQKFASNVPLPPQRPLSLTAQISGTVQVNPAGISKPVLIETPLAYAPEELVSGPLSLLSGTPARGSVTTVAPIESAIPTPLAPPTLSERRLADVAPAATVEKPTYTAPEPLILVPEQTPVQTANVPTPPTRPTFASNVPTPPTRPDDVAPAATIEEPSVQLPTAPIIEPEAVPVVLADLTNPFASKRLVASLPGESFTAAQPDFLPAYTSIPTISSTFTQSPQRYTFNGFMAVTPADFETGRVAYREPQVLTPPITDTAPVATIEVPSVQLPTTPIIEPESVPVPTANVPTPPTRPTFASNAPVPPSRPDDIAPSITVEAPAPELPKPLILQPEEVAVQTANVPLPPSSAGVEALRDAIRAAANDVAPAATLEEPIFSIPAPLIIQPDIPQPIYANVPTPPTRPGNIGSIAASKAVVDINGTLRRGSTGEAVSHWQEFLISQGHGKDSSGEDMPLDGIFGRRTEQATRDFQRAVGVRPDGIFGPETRAVLREESPAPAAPATPASVAPTTPAVQETSAPAANPNRTILEKIWDAIRNPSQFSFTHSAPAAEAPLPPSRSSELVGIETGTPVDQIFNNDLTQTIDILCNTTSACSDKVLALKGADGQKAYNDYVNSVTKYDYAEIKQAQGAIRKILALNKMPYTDGMKVDNILSIIDGLIVAGVNPNIDPQTGPLLYVGRALVSQQTPLTAVESQMVDNMGLKTFGLTPDDIRAKLPPDPAPFPRDLPDRKPGILSESVKTATYKDVDTIALDALQRYQKVIDALYDAHGRRRLPITLTLYDGPSTNVLGRDVSAGEDGGNFFHNDPSHIGVYIDRSVYRARSAYWNPLTVAAATRYSLAHEAGHLLILDLGLRAKIYGSSALATREYPQGVYEEWLADTIAGALMSEAGLLEKGDPWDLYHFWASVPGKVVTHGPPLERAKVVYQGLVAGDIDQSLHFIKGIEPNWQSSVTLPPAKVTIAPVAVSEVPPSVLAAFKNIFPRFGIPTFVIQHGVPPDETADIADLPAGYVITSSPITESTPGSVGAPLGKPVEMIQGQTVVPLGNSVPATKSLTITPESGVTSPVVREVPAPAQAVPTQSPSTVTKFLKWIEGNILGINQLQASPMQDAQLAQRLIARGYNFGNIRDFGFAWEGMLNDSASGGFVRFDSAFNGARAYFRNIFTHYQKWNQQTWNQILEGDATHPGISPRSDGNDSASMAQSIAAAAGLGPNDRIDIFNENQMIRAMNQNTAREFGVPATAVTDVETLVRAYRAAITSRYGSGAIASIHSPVGVAPQIADAQAGVNDPNEALRRALFPSGPTAGVTAYAPNNNFQPAPFVVNPTAKPAATVAIDPALVQKKTDLQNTLANLQTSVRAAEQAQAQAVSLGETAEALTPTLSGLQAGKSVLQTAGEIANKVGNNNKLASDAAELSGKIDQMIPIVQGGIANPMSLMGSSDQLAQALKGIFASGKEIAARAETAASTEVARITEVERVAQATPTAAQTGAPLAFAPADISARPTTMPESNWKEEVSPGTSETQGTGSFFGQPQTTAQKSRILVWLGVRNINPVIYASMEEAVKHLPPGYTIRIVSAARNSSTVGAASYHVKKLVDLPANLANALRAAGVSADDGLAVDISIVMPDGRSLNNIRAPENFHIYREFMQNVKAAQDRLYPQFSNFGRWGGYFTTRADDWKGDIMHYDLGPITDTAAGNWHRGLFPQYSFFSSDPSQVGKGVNAPYQIASAPGAATTPDTQVASNQPGGAIGWGVVGRDGTFTQTPRTQTVAPKPSIEPGNLGRVEGVRVITPGQETQTGWTMRGKDPYTGMEYACTLDAASCTIALRKEITIERLVGKGYSVQDATKLVTDVTQTLDAKATPPTAAPTDLQTTTDIPMLSVPQAPTHLYAKPGGQMSDQEIKQVLDYGARVGGNYWSQDYAKRGKTYALPNVNLIMRDQVVGQVMGSDASQPEQSGAYYNAKTNTVWIDAAEFKKFASKYDLTGEDLISLGLHEIGHHVGSDLGLQPGMNPGGQDPTSAEAQANFFAAKAGVATGLFNQRILQNLIKTQVGVYGPVMADAIQAGAAAATTDIDTSVQAFFKATPKWDGLPDLKIAQAAPVQSLALVGGVTVPGQTFVADPGSAQAAPTQTAPAAQVVSPTAQKPALIDAVNNAFDQITGKLMPFANALAILMQWSARNRKSGTLPQPTPSQQTAGDGVPPPTPEEQALRLAQIDADIADLALQQESAELAVVEANGGAEAFEALDPAEQVRLIQSDARFDAYTRWINVLREEANAIEAGQVLATDSRALVTGATDVSQGGFNAILRRETPLDVISQPGGLRVALRQTFYENGRVKLAVIGGTVGGSWLASSMIGGIGGGAQSTSADAASSGAGGTGAAAGAPNTGAGAVPGKTDIPTFVADMPETTAPPAAPGTQQPTVRPPQWQPTPGGAPSYPGMPSYTGYPDQSGYGYPMSPWQQQQMQQQQAMQAQQKQAQQQAQQQALQNLLRQQQQQQAQQAAQQRDTTPPTIQFFASPATVTLFASTTLQWTSTNTTSCYIFDPAGKLVTQGTQSGAYPIAAVTETTTYGMTCTSYSYGQNTYATTTVMVATSTQSSRL
jgi:hypothetical protein